MNAFSLSRRAPRRPPPSGASTLIYDPNGLNPYARELSRVLSASTTVEVLQPRSAEPAPAPSRSAALLGTDKGYDGYAVHVLLRLLAPIFLIAKAARARLLIIAWTRDSIDTLACIVLNFLPCVRVVFVDHNPTISRKTRGLHGKLEDKLRSACDVVAVHRAGLLDSTRGARRRVVGHPGYTDWVRRHYSSLSDATREPGHYLIIGNLRRDKGAQQLPGLVSALQAGERLTVAGHAFGLEEGLEDRVTIMGAPGHPLSDENLAAAIAKSDVVLAPFENVTVSGSTIMAASCGRPVVAYDSEPMRELVGAENTTLPRPDALLERARMLKLRRPALCATDFDVDAARTWRRLLRELGP